MSVSVQYMCVIDCVYITPLFEAPPMMKVIINLFYAMHLEIILYSQHGARNI